MQVETHIAEKSLFSLKTEAVQLTPVSRRAAYVTISLAELEATRTHAAKIPASKHGLEAICGASCETGAQ
ncbi:hypothetical protein [Mesorhizobium sp. LSHC414A00]|uniref:hypothetical protein n=1 Tax=Mesorhizobium sp. LSHC414A00 TaxID=1287287 RepID=UPI0003CEB6BD|nr:hypothetical protein [Mesorhizobium sp. LSHC414A00]ESX79999.1 hypothetical protein X757_03265 [Mesorhizobium sp. LSHC414A00]